jgi:hypothetical protein
MGARKTESGDTYRGVVHGDVVDEDVLDNVDLALVLAKGADGDAVRPVTVHVLHEDVGAVRLERDAVCTYH